MHVGKGGVPAIYIVSKKELNSSWLYVWTSAKQSFLKNPKPNAMYSFLANPLMPLTRLVESELLARLKAMPRSVRVKQRGSDGEEVVHPEFVFHSPEGKPYQPNNWSNRVFFPFMRDLNKVQPELPSLTPHELRHTRATLWLAQGISPLMVAKLLGHSDVKMLAKVYDHTTVETLREAILHA